MLKGSLLHEVINLPLLWYRIAQVDTSSLQVEKITFGKQRRQYYLKVRKKKSAPSSLGEKIVFYFHGGGWMFGTPEQFLQNAQVFVDEGYTVYMPSYRRLPYYHMPDITSDLLTAIEKISQNQKRTVTEIIMAGMSAGGHLAAVLALDKSIDWTTRFNLPKPKKYLGIGAPLDLGNMYGWLVGRLAGKKDSAKFKANNPIYHLDLDNPLEIFILSAGQDGMVPYRAKYPFIEKAEQLELNVKHLHWEKATHLEIAHWSIPGSKYHKMVVDYVRNTTESINSNNFDNT